MEIKTNILSLLRSSSYSASGTCRVTRVNNTILHHERGTSEIGLRQT